MTDQQQSTLPPLPTLSSAMPTLPTAAPAAPAPTTASPTPWLPESAPRVVVPPPPRPVDPYARALLNGFNPPTTQRKRHFPWVPLVMVVLLVGAAGAVYKYVSNANKPKPFVVQTESFTFTLPDTPEFEQSVEIGGQFNSWIVPPGKLAVFAISQPLVLTEAEQQLAFDRAVSLGVGGADGTVTSDTWATTNGVYRRDTIMATPEGTVYLVGLGKGHWMVFFGWGPTSESEFPSELADVIATFSFY